MSIYAFLAVIVFDWLTDWLTDLFTFSLAPWSRVLLEKLTSFHGTWRFITKFTSAHHLSLSWASSIQAIPPHPTSWRFIWILSSHLQLGLPSGLFPSSFPTKTLYMPLLSPILVTCPTHLILLDFIAQIISGEEYICTYKVPHYVVSPHPCYLIPPHNIWHVPYINLCTFLVFWHICKKWHCPCISVSIGNNNLMTG